MFLALEIDKVRERVVSQTCTIWAQCPFPMIENALDRYAEVAGI